MAKMWAGRFSKEENEQVNDFNSSISFDSRMYQHDIMGSIAHATMLGEQGIIEKSEADAICMGLSEILDDLKNGRLAVDPSAEDIHMFVEAELTARLGDTGKRLHTARSRNDQVALDIRMYLRDEIEAVTALLEELLHVLCDLAKEHAGTVMSGYTHLQRAQPVSFGHHLMAYAQMLLRDRSRLFDCKKRMDDMPLGSCALAGTTYPLNRERVAEILNFSHVTENSLDGVSDRDFCMELAAALSILMVHLSRFCEEIILWCSWEFKFIELDDAYATGSSIMPQKKNPDIAELVRGKTGRVYAALTSILTTMKGIPLAYNKDMQEDKELTFDAIDTVKGCIALFHGMIKTMTFHYDRMEDSAKHGFTNATDAADYLVNHGVPFRDAHGIVGRLVLLCIERGISLDELPLEDYQAISPVFEDDIYEAISMKTCVEKRNTIGAPGHAAMEKVIAINEAYLADLK